MAKVASFAMKVVRDLADAPELPAFDPETAKLPTGSGSPVRVAFGSIPDFAEHPKGFRINGTTPGSPAEGLGLKAGDVITSFGGRPIRTLYDFQEALSAFKPGDTVKVQWLRGEASLEGQAALRGR
ncbi:MAG: Cell division topological determinant MinJ [Acidobacteria bacterium ADurb.Bin340]|nr:MAG: Cell division topological determinant MinJ [Acidobacteria bacterium ADurb.Bin340]